MKDPIFVLITFGCAILAERIYSKKNNLQKYLKKICWYYMILFICLNFIVLILSVHIWWFNYDQTETQVRILPFVCLKFKNEGQICLLLNWSNFYVLIEDVIQRKPEFLFSLDIQISREKLTSLEIFFPTEENKNLFKEAYKKRIKKKEISTSELDPVLLIIALS
jgi:hypothetical protein